MTTPTVGVAAPAGGRAGRRWQPLAGVALQAAVPAGDAPVGGCRPLRAPLAWPWVADPAWGLAAPPLQVAPTFAANRCNKRVEQFYIRMEKMKEDKCPPL
ncbi:hypothetical protein GW17_00056021 [Ensete ventricosum]|nr:hypothetical protein GW17_00056021 [Ensete ventricosum]